MVYIRNRFTNRLLLHDGGGLVVAPPGPDLDTAAWTMQAVAGTDFVRLCDPADETSCLNVEQGDVALSPVRPGWWSAMWRPEPVSGTDYVRFVNRWKPKSTLQADSGPVEAGPAEPGWWSAMWAVDEELVADARSVHLRYAVDGASAFVIACSAVESQPGTYFCAIGFNGGYVGMQERVDGSKILIFSIWDGDDGARPTLVAAGPDVQMQPFGGEGTGISGRRPYNWSVGHPVSFAVTAQTHAPSAVARHEASTRFGAYVKDSGAWTLLATIDRPATHGALLGGVYSFVEDFRRNGAAPGVAAEDRSPYQRHVGDFSNPWVRGSDGSWSSLDSATFSAWSPQPLENIDATAPEAPDIVLQLATGGPWVQRTELGATVTSSGTPTTPPVHPG